MAKLHITTWGCQMNEYDSSKMADLLNSTHGLELTDKPEEADVLLLNTCSIREKAQEKVFSQLGRWKNWKKDKPELIIGVGGCVASQEGEHIRDRAPFVDIVFGPQTLHRLPEMINKIRGGDRAIVDISFPEIEKFDRLPEPKAEGPTAFVSIMEGCNKYCSFCVVPYTRGEEVSRPVDDVLFEIAQLAEQGVREVNLLGQNVNAYRGETFDGGICTFAELLRLVAAIDGIDRVRYTTSHPIEFTDDIIEVYLDTPELVSFLHLPIQSGADRILTMMKRNHTALEYKAIIRKLREVRPNIQISSDDKIVVEIDHADGVWIEDCVELSKYIEDRLSRDEEDYELEVGSAGLGQPFKVPQQYQNFIGKEVEVLGKDGKKVKGILKSVDGNDFVVAVNEKVQVEGKKRPVKMDVDHAYKMDEVKYTKYIISFK